LAATESRVPVGRGRLDRSGRQGSDVGLDPGPGRLGHQLGQRSVALDEGQITSDRRPRARALDVRPRSAPYASLRILALDRPGPLVADDVAGLKVVPPAGLEHRPALELPVLLQELAPADDRRRGLKHEVLAERALIVARVQTGEHELAGDRPLKF